MNFMPLTGYPDFFQKASIGSQKIAHSLTLVAEDLFLRYITQISRIYSDINGKPTEYNLMGTC